jgi:molybdenum cofactor synthesis domain-containing protein
MSYRAFVLTSSDSGFAGEREDVSGPTAMELLRGAGWEIVGYALLPDDHRQLTQKLCQVCDSGEAELLITTGGTGFSARDCMPEATADAAERMVPGIPEAMRWYSLQITPRAMLSRAAAGIRKNTLIVNLPGSPKAVRENLGAILDTLEHAVHMMRGQGH